MNKKIRDGLFLFICIASAFYPVPFLFYHPVLSIFSGGSGFDTKLVIIPLILGMIYTLYSYLVKKDRDTLVFSKKIVFLACAYLGLMYISLIWGLGHFPFMEQVMKGADQFGQIGKVQDVFSLIGIHLAKSTLISIMIALRTIKDIFFNFLWQFGGVYMIYCWYRNDKKQLLKVFTAGVTAVVVLEFFVCGIEAIDMAGSDRAIHLLGLITPYFHPVNVPGAKLWWSGQFRGTFTEPSYFGMYCAFALPFLWYQLIEQEDKRIKIFYGILSLSMAFDIFMTSSRTALGLFFAEVVLFLILGLVVRNKHLLFMVVITVVLNLVGLGLGNFYMGHIMSPHMREAATVALANIGNPIQNQSQKKNQKLKRKPKDKSSTQSTQTKPVTTVPQNKTVAEQSTLRGYFERTIFSLTDVNKRSNRSRFTISLTNIRIGLDHPILGVGHGLRQPYIAHYLKGQQTNVEINKWLRFQKEKGVLAQVFPNLCDYAVHFAEGGILGLISFLVIPLILLARLVKGVIKEKNFLSGIVLISLIGSLAVGLGDSLSILYVYWLLLGVGFALLESLKPPHEVGKDHSDAPM